MKEKSILRQLILSGLLIAIAGILIINGVSIPLYSADCSAGPCACECPDSRCEVGMMAIQGVDGLVYACRCADESELCHAIVFW